MPDANVWNYVLGAYAVTWGVLAIYAGRLFVLNRRAARLAAEPVRVPESSSPGGEA